MIVVNSCSDLIPIVSVRAWSANDHSFNHGVAMARLQQFDAKLHGEIPNIHDKHDGTFQGRQNARATLVLLSPLTRFASLYEATS